MRAFGRDGPKAPTLGLLSPDATGGISEHLLSSWCFHNPALPLVNVVEALQLLENAGLVCLQWISDDGTRHWSATQLGVAALAQGPDAVRHRITDRTAVSPAMAPPTVPPARRSIAQRLQELETLRAASVISDAEYTAKRAQIIAEI
jgi:hypothetical protein